MSRRDGDLPDGNATLDPDARSERSILVQVTLPGQDRETEARLKELGALVRSAGAQVVGEVLQNRRSPSRSTFLGTGRVEEMKELAERTDATVIVFGHDLSPAQGRNLEEILEMRVVDRSQLIMDIFALRARTYQARLQVELAQLQYSLPRLRRLWTHLDRYKGGIGMRGPGETQIEVDRREIRRKIADRRRKLESLERHHNLQRTNREQYFTVGLLGYTNAGKSTLFNRLCNEDVVAENRPFSTLDTRTRQWKVAPGCTVLLSDTVGFIHDLPHHLIASFHATLAEAIEADLLLHVLDGSRPDAPDLVRSVEEVLTRIGAGDRPRLRVVNKLDQAEDRAMLGGLGTEAVLVSARTGEGIEDLAAAVLGAARRDFSTVELRIPVGDGASLAAIEAHGTVLERTSENGVFHVRAHLPPALAGRLRRYVTVDAEDDGG